MQQGPQDVVIQQGIDSYEQMVNATAFTAKAYWAMWGPWGRPMVEGVDRWAERQRDGFRAHLRALVGAHSPGPLE